MMEYILAPSILAADFKNLGQEMKKQKKMVPDICILT